MQYDIICLNISHNFDNVHVVVEGAGLVLWVGGPQMLLLGFT